MTMMDWGDIGEFVTFGQVGHDQIDDASYYILIAPQNVVGNTILTNLGEMVRLFLTIIVETLTNQGGVRFSPPLKAHHKHDPHQAQDLVHIS